jgi:hypothetical protein
VDWNNDGKHDLMIGNTKGNIQIYINTASGNNPVMAGGEFIFSSGSILNAGTRTAPVAADWNDDGKKDLLVGSMDGNIKIYINIGTDSRPVFNAPVLLKAGGKILELGSRTAPRVADWNRDGLADILVGEMEGHVYYLKNVGTRSAPVFDKAEKLFLKNGEPLKYPDKAGIPRSRLFVSDWNNDGHDDMLVGGMDGKILLYLADPGHSDSPTILLRKMWFQFRERAEAISLTLKGQIKRLI